MIDKDLIRQMTTYKDNQSNVILLVKTEYAHHLKQVSCCKSSKLVLQIMATDTKTADDIITGWYRRGKVTVERGDITIRVIRVRAYHDIFKQLKIICCNEKTDGGQCR